MSETLGDFGDDDIEIQPDESLVDLYIRVRGSEIEPGTKRGYRTSWKKLQEYMESEHPDKTIFDLSSADVEDWYRYLNSEGIRDSTVRSYASKMAGMMRDLREINRIKGTKTPFVDAMTITDFNTSDASKLEVEFSELKNAINDINSPLMLVVVTLLAKYGLRLAELSNIDERDLNLNHPISEYIDDPRREIKNNPNTLYIDSTISEHEVHNGAFRREGNKEKSTRKLPLDQETVQLLAWYLAMRTSSDSPASPVLTIDRSGGINTDVDEYNTYYLDGLGTRPSNGKLYNIIKKFAKENDWYASGKREGMHPHWFRHWFTTIMRSRIDGDEVNIGTVKQFVKGLRGDTGEDVIETYTHDWEDAFEEDVKPYGEIVRSNLPKFFD